MLKSPFKTFAETTEGAKQWLKYHKAADQARIKPWLLVKELQEAASTEGWWNTSGWSVIRVAMTLEAASDRADETRGMLAFKVSP